MWTSVSPMRAEFHLHDLNSGQASSAGFKPSIIYSILVWRVFLRTLIRIVDPTFSNQSNSYSHLAFQWSSSLQGGKNSLRPRAYSVILSQGPSSTSLKIKLIVGQSLWESKSKETYRVEWARTTNIINIDEDCSDTFKTIIWDIYVKVLQKKSASLMLPWLVMIIDVAKGRKFLPGLPKIWLLLTPTSPNAQPRREVCSKNCFPGWNQNSTNLNEHFFQN